MFLWENTEPSKHLMFFLARRHGVFRQWLKSGDETSVPIPAPKTRDLRSICVASLLCRIEVDEVEPHVKPATILVHPRIEREARAVMCQQANGVQAVRVKAGEVELPVATNVENHLDDPL